MASPSPSVQAALSSLRERWGGAAPRWGTEVLGALAVAPSPEESGDVEGRPSPDERAIPTGFQALDAILGLGGLPRTSATALQGDGSSGKTTLALRAVAQTQAAGGIAAYLDLARSLDPVEAAARGVRLDWLVVLVPDSIEEALAMAAMLLQDRAVDLLLLDLGEPRGPSGTSLAPADLGSRTSKCARVGSSSPPRPEGPARLQPALPAPGRAALQPAMLGERLHRLAALARKAGVQVLVLEPPGLPAPVTGALAQIAALRLELTRRAWIRLGRDVVGQRVEVRVSRDRFGPPGRAAELRILYAEGGSRDACLARDELLRETAASMAGTAAGAAPRAGVAPRAGAPPGGLRPVAGTSGLPAFAVSSQLCPPGHIRCDSSISTGPICSSAWPAPDPPSPSRRRGR